MEQALWHLPDHLSLQLPHQSKHGNLQGENAAEVSPEAFLLVLLLFGQIGEQIPLEGVIGCLLVRRGRADLTSQEIDLAKFPPSPITVQWSCVLQT